MITILLQKWQHIAKFKKKNHMLMKWIEINNFYFRYMRYISDTSISSFSGIKIQISIFAVYT